MLFPAMRVPLLDLNEQYHALAGAIRAELDQVFATQYFILGPKLGEFEEAIAGFLRSPHAIGVSSGTDALLATFMALEIGPGDAVVTSSFSFFATAGCIARVGAKPIFIDIDPATSPATPATRILACVEWAAATPSTRLPVDRIPSFAPSTAALSPSRRSTTVSLPVGG